LIFQLLLIFHGRIHSSFTRCFLNNKMMHRTQMLKLQLQCNMGIRCSFSCSPSLLVCFLIWFCLF
jgi:hypothetical protein